MIEFSKTKYKNKKIDQEKYESCLEFYEYKKALINDKIERLKNLSPQQNAERIRRVDVLKESLGRTFMAIANGRIKTPQFIGYPLVDREEMISDALYIMLRYADRFDCRRTNPFSYFTQTAFNSFIAFLGEKKRHEKKYQSIDYIENINSIQNVESGLE